MFHVCIIKKHPKNLQHKHNRLHTHDLITQLDIRTSLKLINYKKGVNFKSMMTHCFLESAYTFLANTSKQNISQIHPNTIRHVTQTNTEHQARQIKAMEFNINFHNKPIPISPN